MRNRGRATPVMCTLGSAREDATHGGGGMPWVWSDELAARLLEAGVVEPDALDRFSQRPVAFAVDDSDDMLSLGPKLLELEAWESLAS